MSGIFHSMTFDTTHPPLNGKFLVVLFIPFLAVLEPLEYLSKKVIFPLLSNDKVEPGGVTKVKKISLQFWTFQSI